MKHDTMSEVRALCGQYWTAQTGCSRNHLPGSVGRENMPRGITNALGVLKKAAAITLRPSHREDDGQKLAAIVQACDEVV